MKKTLVTLLLFLGLTLPSLLAQQLDETGDAYVSFNTGVVWMYGSNPKSSVQMYCAAATTLNVTTTRGALNVPIMGFTGWNGCRMVPGVNYWFSLTVDAYPLYGATAPYVGTYYIFTSAPAGYSLEINQSRPTATAELSEESGSVE